MKTQILLLRIAGVINLFFMIFHLSFYKIFAWNTGLNCLSSDNRSIMLTYHAVSILLLGFMALIPLAQARSLISSPIKYTLLSFFSLFYLVRIVTEFTLFGFAGIQSLIILAMCIVPMVLFAIPLFHNPER